MAVWRRLLQRRHPMEVWDPEEVGTVIQQEVVFTGRLSGHKR